MQTETVKRPPGRISALERSPHQRNSFIVDQEAFEQVQEIVNYRLENGAIVVGTNQHKPTGFVRVEETGNERNPFCFSGILLPHEWEEPGFKSEKPKTRLRNRMMIIGKYAYDWFAPFCKEILFDGTNMRLRVRVNTHGDNLAFILPCARTPEHAKAEWTLANANFRSKQPPRLYMYSPEQLARKIYEHLARIEGGSITHYIDSSRSAIVVDRYGFIHLLSNGDQIEKYTGSLQRHDVVMDRNIRDCVQVKQLNSLKELNLYLNDPSTVDANTQYQD